MGEESEVGDGIFEGIMVNIIRNEQVILRGVKEGLHMFSGVAVLVQSG